SCSSSASLADQYTVLACLAIRRTRAFLNLIHRTLAGVFIALDMLVIQILTAVVEANSNNGSNYCTNYRTRGTSRPCNCTSNRRPSNRVSPIGVTELVRVVVRVPVAVELAHGIAVGRHGIHAQELADTWIEVALLHVGIPGIHVGVVAGVAGAGFQRRIQQLAVGLVL